MCGCWVVATVASFLLGSRASAKRLGVRACWMHVHPFAFTPSGSHTVACFAMLTLYVLPQSSPLFSRAPSSASRQQTIAIARPPHHATTKVHAPQRSETSAQPALSCAKSIQTTQSVRCCSGWTGIQHVVPNARLPHSDESAPTWLNGYPVVSLIQPRQINVDIIQSESGFFYWVVLEVPDPANPPAAPTSAQVRAGTAPVNPKANGFQAVNKLTLATGVNMGLKSSTKYHIYIVAEDTMPNLMSPPTLIEAQTPSDPTPPSWMNGFPRIVSVTETSIGFESRLSEDGIVFYVLVPSGGSPPTSAQVRSATVPNKQAAGNDEVLQGGVTISSLITGVDPYVTYILYAVAEDGDGNLQANPVGMTIRTDPPPAWMSGFPRVTNVGPDRGTFEVALGEQGKVYWCLLPAQTHAPANPSVVKGGACPSQLTSGSITVGTIGATFSNVMTGLNPHTTYFVYSVPEDVTGNLGFVVTSNTFQTSGPDTTPPGYVLGFPLLKSVRDTWVEIETQLTEPGTVYVAVRLATSGGEPSAADVRAGTDASFVTTGSASVAAASTSVVVPQTGLAVQTNYVAWVVAADTTGNLQTIAVDLAFTTTPDQTAPDFKPGYPKIENIAETSADLRVQLTEPGTVWYMVVPTGTSAPTTQAVIDGNSGVSAGTAAVPSSGVTHTLPMTGLQGSHTYDLYLVTRDGLGNTLSPPTKLQFTTANDNSAPTYAAGFPVIKEAQDKGVITTIKIDEPGNVFVLVVARDAAAPTASQVRSGSGISGGSATVAALAERDILVLGLTPSTPYDLYVLAEDGVGNQAALKMLQFVTVAVDTFAPRFLLPFPRLTGVTDTSVTLESRISEPGTVFWGLVPASGASTPSCAQVEAGTVPGTLAAGSTPAPSAGVTATSNINSGISLGNSYLVYVCSKDTAGNMVGPPETRSFTASAVDSTAPDYVTTYPKVTGITDTAATIVVQLTEPGNFYFLIVARNAAQPTSSAVKAGTGGVTAGSGGVSQAQTSYAATGHGLQSNHDYDVWIVAEDTQNNLQATATKLQFKTSSNDLTAPKFSSGYPKVTDVTDSTCLVNVQLDEPGTAYFTILPESATKPTPLQIQAGTGAVSFGTVAVAAATTTATKLALGLTIDTAYTLWVVAKDVAGNFQATASDGVHFRTANIDTTAPLFQNTYPKIHVTTDTGVSAKVRLNEPAKVFMLVVDNNAAAPTAANVKAGVGGVVSGNGPVASAFTDVILTIASGLQPETDYDLYLVAEDESPQKNLQATATKLDFKTTQDQTDPLFLTGFPKAVNPSHDAVTLEVQLNEVGTVFFCIVNNGAGASFSSAQVRARNCGTSFGSGTIDVVADQVTYSKRTQDPFMVEMTDYDIIVVAEDPLGNLQDAPTKVDFTTTQDTEAPTSTVSMSGNTKQVVLDITISEPGTAFWVIVPAIASGGATPTPGDVTGGTGVGGSTPTAHGSRVVTERPLTFQVAVDASNFPTGTGFDSFVVAVDDASSANRQNPPSRASIGILPDGIAPGFLSDSPIITNVGETSFVIETTLSEVGKWHAIVLPQNAPSPTSVEVQASTGAGGSTAVASVSNVDAPVANEMTSAKITGLVPGAGYDVWVVAEDLAGNVGRLLRASARRLGNLQDSPTRLQVVMVTSSNQGGNSGGGAIATDDPALDATWLPIVIVLLILLIALCICCCVRYYKRKARKARYHPVEPIVLARSRTGSFSSHGSALSDGSYDGAIAMKHRGRRRGSGSTMGSRPGTADSFVSQGPPGSVNNMDEFGAGMDVVDLEADLQAAENVAQRAMNRPQEELQSSEHFGSKDIMGMVGAKAGSGDAAAAAAGAGAAGGATGAGSGANSASNVTRTLMQRGGMMMEEEVITTTTTEVVRVDGANPLDRVALPNQLGSPGPAVRHSGAPRRASLLAPLGGASTTRVEDSILISEIVDGIHEEPLSAPVGRLAPLHK